LRISGYDIEAYDLSSAHEQLRFWRKGAPIRYAEYDHHFGATGDQIKTIEPCSFLILDGLHSMHALFAPLLSFSIFIWTEDDTLRAIRH
jgi:uridine kinase